MAENKIYEILLEIHGEVKGIQETVKGKVDVRECERHRQKFCSDLKSNKNKRIDWLLTIIVCIITAWVSITVAQPNKKVDSEKSKTSVAQNR